MAVGGLRGAIAFALVYMIDKGISHKRMFVTTTLFIILFTVIVLGTVTKPLVEVLRVRRQEKSDKSSSGFINRKVIELLIPVIEEFAGHHKTGWWMAKLESLNNNCLQRFLVKGGAKTVAIHDDLLRIKQPSKHDDRAPTSGPFKEATQGFGSSAYDDDVVDPAMEQFKKDHPRPIEAVKVNRERVQYSKNIGQAFDDSKVEKKPRVRSLDLGGHSRAPLYKKPAKTVSQVENKATGKPKPNTENELKSSVNKRNRK